MSNSQKYPTVFYQITGHLITFTHKINRHISLTPPSPLCLIYSDFSILRLKRAALHDHLLDLSLSPLLSLSYLCIFYLWVVFMIYYSVFICEISLICIFPTKSGDPEGQGLLWLVHYSCYIEQFVVCLT